MTQKMVMAMCDCAHDYRIFSPRLVKMIAGRFQELNIQQCKYCGVLRSDHNLLERPEEEPKKTLLDGPLVS